MSPNNQCRNRINQTVALVSHNYNGSGHNDCWDYSEHFRRINQRCDDEGCQTILYALYTLDRAARVRSHDAIFGGLANVNTVILETGDLAGEDYDSTIVEVWRRDHAQPLSMKQAFAASSASDTAKQSFMAALPHRRVADALVVICGESNIAGTWQREWSDPHEFAMELDKLGVRLILNPIHDYMPWSAMLEKRRRYAEGGRSVVSVWNQGRSGEERELPWTVFVNGEERAEMVRELPTLFVDRPDIKIGIMDVSS